MGCEKELLIHQTLKIFPEISSLGCFICPKRPASCSSIRHKAPWGGRRPAESLQKRVPSSPSFGEQHRGLQYLKAAAALSDLARSKISIMVFLLHLPCGENSKQPMETNIRINQGKVISDLERPLVAAKNPTLTGSHVKTYKTQRDLKRPRSYEKFLQVGQDMVPFCLMILTESVRLFS